MINETTGFRALLLCDEVFGSITEGLLARPDDMAILDTERNINDKDAFDLLIELARQSKHWHKFLETDEDVQTMVSDSFQSGYYYGKYGKSLEE